MTWYEAQRQLSSWPDGHAIADGTGRSTTTRYTYPATTPATGKQANESVLPRVRITRLWTSSHELGYAALRACGRTRRATRPPRRNAPGSRFAADGDRRLLTAVRGHLGDTWSTRKKRGGRPGVPESSASPRCSAARRHSVLARTRALCPPPA